MNNKLLSIYGSHDAAATFIDNEGKLRILEYERFVKIRYAMFSSKYDSWGPGTNDDYRKKFIEYIKTQLKEEPDTIVYNELNEYDLQLIQQYFPNATFKLLGHHISHASGAFYQSGFDEAIIVAIDGGGYNCGTISSTCVFYGKKNNITELYSSWIDYGNTYSSIGSVMKDISPDYSTTSLTYAGKVMGICAYGDVVQEWIQPMKNFYNHGNLQTLGNEIGMELYNQCHSIVGKNAYDLAATSQYVFEEILFNFILKYLNELKCNLVFCGGCALNVLFNQKLKEYMSTTDYDLYVPPNPNDCGLSIGQYLLEVGEKINPIVYGGFDILDREEIFEYMKIYNFQKLNVNKIVDLIKDGKIGGIIQGYSEVGPRALGNRSIICDPSIKDMKDIINSKVKFREWFRPFAPVCREEDKDLYFENAFPSEYMSFAPKVKEKFRTKLPSITHADGTARLQTVTKKQHQLFYDILTELNLRNEIAVIMNTSFNIKGKPILTKVEDAFYVLENTELDFIIVENYLIEK
jgi:carbamoyltransferase